MSEETQKRKADHIRICLDDNAQAKEVTTGFEDINLIHKALPEIDKKEISLSTSVFGHKFSAPIMVGALTGGTRQAEKINATIAEAVEELQLGMGLGSQRAAIEDKKLAKTFSIARKKAPTAFLIANLGAVQLTHGYGLNEIKKAIEMIEADAIAIHLNILQEAIQPEGQTNFKNILLKIKEITDKIDKPVIIKETGSGFAAEEAKNLESAGVQGIDIGGVGGTSFAAVEYHRTHQEENIVQRRLGETFWDWGIPTAISLAEVTTSVKIPVIASGGIRNGMEATKALALGAKLTSIAQPALKTSLKGAKETKNLLTLFAEEIRNAMFLVGAKKPEDLSQIPLVITGKTAEWLKARNFKPEEYAKRGA